MNVEYERKKFEDFIRKIWGPNPNLKQGTEGYEDETIGIMWRGWYYRAAQDHPECCVWDH